MQQVVVMKFGGTSVGSTERIKNVAKRVLSHQQETGERVVVVVSAMSGETDRLINLSREILPSKMPSREYHQLVTAGEHVSVALTAMALQEAGAKSVSLLAHQISMQTKSVFGQNLIDSIDASKITAYLDNGVVPVIAGFQGVDDNGDYTTLGRGGSDTTAVAIAAALGSVPCYILTDIDGVYTALPSICKKAKKLDSLTYEEMLELASSGAKILQTRSVALAHKHRVPTIVCSSFDMASGTEIVEEYEGMEDSVVSGISFRSDEVKYTMRNLPDEPGVAAAIFKALAEAGVVVDMIVQSQGKDGRAVISFTFPDDAIEAADAALGKLVSSAMPEAEIEKDLDVAKLSVVGEGMRTNAGVAANVFDVLGENGINVDLISTSEIKISVIIQQRYAELAVRVLHEHFIEKA